jgi:hypothetical protein
MATQHFCQLFICHFGLLSSLSSYSSSTEHRGRVLNTLESSVKVVFWTLSIVYISVKV